MQEAADDGTAVCGGSDRTAIHPCRSATADDTAADSTLLRDPKLLNQVRLARKNAGSSDAARQGRT